LKEKKLLSEILTVEDEAFALLIIDNEHHVWLKQIKRDIVIVRAEAKTVGRI